VSTSAALTTPSRNEVINLNGPAPPADGWRRGPGSSLLRRTVRLPDRRVKLRCAPDRLFPKVLAPPTISTQRDQVAAELNGWGDDAALGVRTGPPFWISLMVSPRRASTR